MRECNKCKENKATNQFYKQRQNRDGLRSTCIPCEKSRKLTQYYPGKETARKKGYASKRAKTDINFKLQTRLRSRLWHALKNNQKTGSAISDLGCSIEEFRIHLESRFASDMSWSNHGKWHIDHIKPLAGFDLTDKEQLKKACHYTNLQPLWAKDNLEKGNKNA